MLVKYVHVSADWYRSLIWEKLNQAKKYIDWADFSLNNEPKKEYLFLGAHWHILFRFLTSKLAHMLFSLRLGIGNIRLLMQFRKSEEVTSTFWSDVLS